MNAEAVVSILEAMKGIVAIVAVFSIPLLSIYLWHRRSMAKNRERPIDEETRQKEAQIVEELYHSIKKLRTRVENLETIYMDRPNRNK